MLYILFSFSWLNNINQSALTEGAKLGPKFWISNPLNQTLSYLSETKIGYLKEYILVALQIKMGKKGEESLSCPAAWLPTFRSFSFWSSVLSLHCPTPCGGSDSSEPPKWERQLKCHSHLPKQNFIPPNVLITCNLVYICSRLFGCSHACLFLKVVLWLGRDNEDRLNFLSPPMACISFPRFLLLTFKLEIRMSETGWEADMVVFLQSQGFGQCNCRPSWESLQFLPTSVPRRHTTLGLCLVSPSVPHPFSSLSVLVSLALTSAFSVTDSWGPVINPVFPLCLKVIKVKTVLHRWSAITNATAIKLSLFQGQKRRGL